MVSVWLSVLFMYRHGLTTVKRHRGEPGLLPPANTPRTPRRDTHGTHGTHLGQSDTRITHRRNLTTNQPSLRPSQLSRPTNAHTHSRATSPEPTEPAEPTEPRGRGLRRDTPRQTRGPCRPRARRRRPLALVWPHTPPQPTPSPTHMSHSTGTSLCCSLSASRLDLT